MTFSMIERQIDRLAPAFLLALGMIASIAFAGVGLT
jgi:hypothetical protein